MNVIQLIAKMGSTANFDETELNRELQALDLDPELKAAIENKDQQAIERILGSNTNLMMVLVPAEPDEEPAPDDEPGDKPEEEIRRAG